jgi:hypothetical protein
MSIFIKYFLKNIKKYLFVKKNFNQNSFIGMLKKKSSRKQKQKK